MLNWFKFIAQSIIRNKDAKNAANRSAWNCLFFTIISILLMTMFFKTGYNASFSNHYHNATAFQTALDEVVYNQNFNCVITKTSDGNALSCQNNKADGTPADGDYDKKENQKIYLEKTFAVNVKEEVINFELYVDTREQNAYVEYELSYINKNDVVISKDDYAKLNDAAKKEYSPHLQYKNTLISYDTTLMERISTYFAGVSDEKILDAVKQIQELVNEDEKNAQLYNLYLSLVEPNALDSRGYAPRLIDYYMHIFSENKENSNMTAHPYVIMLLQHEAYFNFIDDKGVFVTFYGLYSGLEGYTFQYSALDTPEKQDTNRNTLVNTIYKDFEIIVGYAFLVSIFRYIPFLLILALALAFFLHVLVKLSHDDYTNNRFMGAFNIVFATFLSAALIASIAGFIFPIWYNIETSFNICITIFISVIIARCLFMGFVSYYKARKKLKYATGNKEVLAGEEMDLM